MMSLSSNGTILTALGAVKLFADKVKGERRLRAVEHQRLESELQY